MITYGIPSLFYFVLKYFFKISQITNLVEKENQNHTFKFLSKSTNSIQLPLHLKFPEFSQTLSPIRPLIEFNYGFLLTFYKLCHFMEYPFKKKKDLCVLLYYDF